STFRTVIAVELAPQTVIASAYTAGCNYVKRSRWKNGVFGRSGSNIAG
ncbi:MAG: hypothetical protein ACI8UR_002379, partial [Natronomonas sp.]